MRSVVKFFQIIPLLWSWVIVLCCCGKPQIYTLTRANNRLAHFPDNDNTPAIYCFNGTRKEIRGVFRKVSIVVHLDYDHFELFEGGSAEEVIRNVNEHQSSWSSNIFLFWKRKSINVNPFNRTCIGILTSRTFEVTLLESDFDYFQFCEFLMGTILFVYADKLSRNQLFYYLCGISFGVFGSIFVFMFLISRLIPNKRLMYGMAVGGWTLFFYFLQRLTDNIKLLLARYNQYVLGYVAVSGLISFAVCYRFGPPTNPRSKNLIKWFLQIVGLLLIFYCSYLYEVNYMIDVVLLLSRVVPFSSTISGVRLIKNKIFRPNPKLLTRKEYAEQGEKETRKALEELRSHCSSPEYNTWKTVLRLKNPVRFAEFMESSRHLSDEEVEEYDSLSLKPDGTIITDDSEDSIAEFTEEDLSD